LAAAEIGFTSNEADDALGFLYGQCDAALEISLIEHLCLFCLQQKIAPDLFADLHVDDAAEGNPPSPEARARFQTTSRQLRQTI
jgi:hypothetical protein